MMRKLIAILILSTGAFCSQGQQQPMYTQYMFNGLLINPAYAGIDQMVSATAQTRLQWLGFDGAPETHTFSVHSPMKNELVSGGLTLMHDKIGVTRQSYLTTSWSYKVLFKETTLALGLQGGATFVNMNLNSVELPDPNDPFFMGNEVRSWIPNFGVGAFYYSSNYYIGASIPHFMNNPLRQTNYKQIRHYFVAGGYVFDINEDFKLKPNFLIKGVNGSPIQFDLNANVLFKDRYWLGVSYRSSESFDLLLEANIGDQFRLGYSYDLVTFQLSRNASHEIMLNYRFTLEKHKSVEKPYKTKIF